jgi:hypothetical protein
MSYIFDKNSSLIYLLTDRNQIFRYKILQTNSNIEFDEKHIYGFHAYNILSIGLCHHKSWLITLGGDNWIKILDYKNNNREIISKYIPDGAYAVTGTIISFTEICFPVFYLNFFFRKGEKLFRRARTHFLEDKSVVSNAKTANSGRVKSMSGVVAPFL